MNISKTTIVRTVMLLIVIINLALEKAGVDIIKADENSIAAIVEYLVEIAVIVSAWWYNNSFSEDALKAQKFFKNLKCGAKNTA